MKSAFIVLFITISLPLIAENFIPRHVQFNIEDTVPVMTGEILYSAITDIQPIIIARNGEKAHNGIIISEMEGQLRFALYESELLIDERLFRIEETDEITSICHDVAKYWKDYLKMTEPEIREELVVEQDLILKEISYNRLITKPFQLNLWLPISGRIGYTTSNNMGNQFIWLGPFSTEFNWFFNESIGLIAAVQVDFGDNLSFARSDPGSNVNTEYLKILPGVGIIFRSIGRFSAEVGVKLYFGAIAITPLEDAATPDLNAGETGWYFYPALELFANLSWNFSEHWSLKAQLPGFEMSLSTYTPEGLGFGYPANATMILTFLRLGAAYRW
ncbi:MAG: hypothetical protein KAH21_09740 [Spirochaetaceae bacterium]|nr:hypothetical protein [Spirochaetaceae bacterium]